MPTRNPYFLTFILLSSFIAGCSPRLQQTATVPAFEEQTPEPEPEKQRLNGFEILASLPPESFSIYLNALVDSIVNDASFTVGGEIIFSRQVLPELYLRGLFHLNWQNQKNRNDALTSLENSWQDGLQPEDYHLKTIQDLHKRIMDSESPNLEDIGFFDILLTDATLKYASHLVKGKLDPRTLDLNWDFGKKELPGDAVKIFIDALRDTKVCETIGGLRPQHWMYQRFIDERIRYQRIKDNGGWEGISFGPTIKPGEKSNVLPALRRRLAITGEISDSLTIQDSVYSGDLVAEVKHFQLCHGLEPDGVIGRNTMNALNATVDERIRQINVNMERLRWVINDFSKDMALINIAGYKMFLYQDSSRTFEAKVMVGTSLNQTPVLKSKLNYLVFNPSWTVPHSIATNEILPKLQEDHKYLEEKNMVLLNSQGKTVDPSTIDWKGISPNNFRYIVRQSPGPGNALGQVKFMFPNNYSVYLHDTPSRYLFSREERAFSHGCIRVQNPLTFAEKLLQDKNWDMEKIKEVIDKGEEKTVHLRKPVDVFLYYWTSGFLDNGEIYFIKDVYNFDLLIDKYLRATDGNQLSAA